MEARGTVGTIRVLERVLGSDQDECVRNKVSTMSKCFVRGASLITFQNCHSNDDRVTLVPYYGHHHQTHDQRIRHVPLLENGTQPPQDIQECHAFHSFCVKFLDQIKVCSLNNGCCVLKMDIILSIESLSFASPVNDKHQGGILYFLMSKDI